MDMQAVEITTPGGPDVLRLTRRPIPVPGPGEVLIRVAAFGLNRPDIAQRQGRYPVPAGVTDIPGLEVSGEIIGGDLTHPANDLGLRLGDRVCALVQGGGYAEYCVAPIAQCLPYPAGFDHVQAAALPETFYTVWSNVFERGALGRGPKGQQETLLVHGGSSGIGTVAIQLAVQRGHRVFATAGSAEKCAFCESLGATRAINYREEDFAAVIASLTDGQGVDVILDMVGGDYLPRELACAADDGRIVIIALQQGAQATIPLSDILRRRVTITGSTLRPRSVAFKGELARELYTHVWPLLAQGAIKPVIETVLPPSEIVTAHRLMDAGAHKGKILLSWDS